MTDSERKLLLAIGKAVVTRVYDQKAYTELLQVIKEVEELWTTETPH